MPSPPSQAIAITVQHFTYNDDDLTLLRSLKYRPFSHIYHDGHYQFVFDFSDNHITACPTDFAATTQNKSDEAIMVGFESKTGTFNPTEQDKCLFTDAVIERLWITRTVLYFTDFTQYESEEDAIRDIPDTPPTGRKLRELLRTTTGGYSEIVCHPDFAHLDPSFSDEHANLVDAGVLMQIGERFLSCFSRNNGFIITTVVQSQQESGNDDDIPNYNLIEL